ncbi:MAG: DUF87 domain-containing protein [Candidatus Micrarchaeota archaeon]|nr:DUF87 domain-containing protein [Candidatus Micrarchaeota archaeon]
MFFNKNTITLGSVRKELSLPRFIYGEFANWKWKGKFFKSFSIDPLTATNPHMAIAGESGSGKSNLCRLILGALAQRDIAFILFDPHNEYVEYAREFGAQVYDASYSGINPFDLQGLSEKEKASEIINLFKKVFHLGSVQGYVLYKCVAFAYKISQEKGKPPVMGDLLFCMKRFKLHANLGERKILESLEKRIAMLDGPTFSRGTELSRIINSRSIFALSSLHTSEAQSIYLEGFLKHLYIMMLGMEKSKRVRLYVVIDEAEKLSESPTIARLVAEGRKYGIGIICISQRAKALHSELRSNSSLFVAFGQHEPEELNYISNFIAQGNERNRYIEVKKAMRNLRKGQAIVLDSHSREPKLVSFRLFSPGVRDPTHRMLMLARNGISKQELYNKLRSHGFSKEEMGWALSGQMRCGAIKSYHLPSSKYAGTWYITHPKNSAEHDICVNLIHRHLASLGINSVVYNSSYGPDVIAFVKGKRIALEYETGLNHLEQATKMIEGRKSKFAGVVVIASESSLRRYSKIEGINLISAADFFESKELLWGDAKDHADAPRDPDPAGKEA